TIDDSFAGTPEAIWLAEHCWEYGFIIRYPQGKQAITGYKYEPWHIRYVGSAISKKIHEMGDDTTLEELYGLTSQYE
ncbi:MAG TPA: D-alanyl-D-alanine carboxypeptidase family protein, partial [Ruminococcus flavefaciens]|nr:D-alanyl-D-alanine carboxypeptidase family protein [Ruminococcus flavefaciens]